MYVLCSEVKCSVHRKIELGQCMKQKKKNYYAFICHLILLFVLILDDIVVAAAVINQNQNQAESKHSRLL